MKRLWRTSASWIFLLALGCGGSVDSGSPPQATPGRRMVVLAPVAAEMVEALGSSDEVIAIGSRGPWPPSLKNLPSVGRFDAPSLERILEASATHVLSTRSAAAAPSVARLRSNGITVVELDTDTFEGVFDSLERLGRLLDRSDIADRIQNEIRQELNRIRSCTDGQPRPAVLFVVGRDPLFVAGPGSHLDVLLDYAGADNVFGDGGATYRQVSMEAVVERVPDLILELQGRGAADPLDAWQRWTFLPAVASGHVYGVDAERLAMPGVRLPEMAALLADRIHPGAVVRDAAGDSWRCGNR